MAKITIDPITRISGLLEIEVNIENNKIIEANSSGMQFRGFEKMFQGRAPLDMIRLTCRTCGICSCHHATASSKALEEALKVTPDPNGELIRELTNGFEYLQNHLRQIYQFVFPDYVDLSSISDLHKPINKSNVDYRLPDNINDTIVNHYLESIQNSRNAHKAEAILAGKAPHNHGVFVGGTTTYLDIQKYQEVKAILFNIKKFITDCLIPDINAIANYYEEYFYMGKGYGNLMCTKLFYNKNIPIKYVKGGVLINNQLEEFLIKNVVEEYRHTWLTTHNNMAIPIQNPPEIDTDKEDAYSWVAAARYKGFAMEVGPLARMTIGGYYDHGISAMDRIIARVLESEKICQCMESLLDYIKLQPAYQSQYDIPKEAKGVGIMEASRGTLLHFIEIENSVVKNYNLIPPSVWNFSPKDNNNVRGPVEEALVGTQINDINKAPTIIGRIVRSFDPCLNCAAHVTSDKYSPFTINIV